MVLGKNFKKCRCSFFVDGLKILIGNKFRPPKSSMGSQFQPGSPQKRSFFESISTGEPISTGESISTGGMRGSPTTPLNSATLWGSCCSKTIKVVFVADNCWFYQKVKKNWGHKWKLSAPERGRQKFLSSTKGYTTNMLPRGTRQKLLKSYS